MPGFYPFPQGNQTIFSLRSERCGVSWLLRRSHLSWHLIVWQTVKRKRKEKKRENRSLEKKQKPKSDSCAVSWTEPCQLQEERSEYQANSIKAFGSMNLLMKTGGFFLGLFLCFQLLLLNKADSERVRFLIPNGPYLEAQRQTINWRLTSSVGIWRNELSVVMHSKYFTCNPWKFVSQLARLIHTQTETIPVGSYILALIYCLLCL